MPRNFESGFDFEPHKNPENLEYGENSSRENEFDLRHESEIFLDHERIDNRKDIDSQMVQLRDSLSEDSDGIIRLPIPAYDYDFATNPFVGLSFRATKTYEISRYVDVVFLHRFMYQDIIVCGLQSRKFVDEKGRAALVKRIRETGGMTIDDDDTRQYEILGKTFAPFMQYHTTDPFFRLYHTIMPRVAERPHFPLDVWLIFDASAYEEVPGSPDFRQGYRLRSGYSRAATLLGVAQIN